MAKKNQSIYPFKIIEPKFTLESKLHIDNFFKLYKDFRGYRSALGFLFYFIEKYDIKNLTMEDFNFINELIEEENTKSKKGTFIKTFFEYLYAYDIINDTRFDDIWIKADKKNYFDKKIYGVKENKIVVETSHEPKKKIIDFGKLNDIEDLVKQTVERKNIVRCFVAWYLLFETNLLPVYIREIKRDSYTEKGVLDSEGNEIVLPENCQEFWYEYHKRNKNGFGDLDKCIKNLGNMVGLDNLTPTEIKNTRDAVRIVCFNCEQAYKNNFENWVSVNGRIVCKKCSEELKKNTKYSIDEIEQEQIESNEPKTNLSAIYTFEQLKKKYLKTDYLSRHKKQIEIGDLGEAFVFDREFEKLKNTDYCYMLESKSDDETNGYDILSFELDGTEIFIEVKTSENVGLPFYISEHERKVAEKLINEGKRYSIYRVENILADCSDDVIVTIINNIFDSSKYKFETYQWRVGII
ncbi:MAG: DUF3883 domain-containing protein [Bacillota bacterium]|nr:DUF3883 domain-containing protein [Bacillota bacterium]